MKHILSALLVPFVAPLLCAAGPVGPLPAVADAWQRVGVRPGIPDYAGRVTADLSADPADGASNARALQRVIDEAPLGTVVQVPPGFFHVAGEISLRTGRVLRGAGAGMTTLHFANLPAAYRGYLNFHGMHGRGTAITGGLAQGSTRIEVADNYGIPVGAAIMLTQLNDPRWMATNNPADWDQPWADRAVGQMVRVVARSHQVFEIDEPVRYHDYRADREPRYYVLTGRVEYAGVEDLSLEVEPDAEGAGRFTVQFNLAENCWLRGVVSRGTQRGHVNLMHAREVEVRDNRFEGAHRPGPGRGLGVDLALRSSQCLIAANTFDGLRHALLVQTGANGNVVAANTVRTAVSGTPDIAIRGHWTYLNLVEGNDVGSIDVGGYWGPAGEGTTLYRNRVGRGGISINDRSYRTLVVGNTLASDADVAVDTFARETFVADNRVLTSPDRMRESNAGWPASLWRSAEGSQ